MAAQMTRRNREVVVVTGASAGVGRATVREFARRGADVGLIARGVDALEVAKSEVEQCGGRAIVLPCDVSDAEAVDAAAERVERELGPIDVWVNDAMNSVFAPVHQVTAAEYQRVTNVTYLGQVYGALAALKRMRQRNRGSIVFVGSALAYRGIPLQSAYCAAKHAIQGFFDSLRSELIHEKSRIEVTMVQLSAFNTPQFTWVRCKLPNKPRPLGGPVYQPEVAARAIYWAAHHHRRELYVGYPAVEAILGNKLAAWYGDEYLAEVGYQGQQTDQPISPNRRDNLDAPVPGDHGAHGPFNAISQESCPQLWASTHRNALALAAAGAVGFAMANMLGGA